LCGIVDHHCLNFTYGFGRFEPWWCFFRFCGGQSFFRRNGLLCIVFRLYCLQSSPDIVTFL